MYYIYVIKSLGSKHYYTGYTNDLNSRLNAHNSGKSKWTKQHRPWKMIYNEDFQNKNDALRREKYLKTHAGRNWLRKILKGQ